MREHPPAHKKNAPPPQEPQDGRCSLNSREERDCTATTRGSATIGGRKLHDDDDRHRTHGSRTRDTGTTAPLAPPHRIRLLTRRVGAVVNNGQERQYHDALAAKGDGARQPPGVLSGAAAPGGGTFMSSARMALGAWAASARKAHYNRHLAKTDASDSEGQQVE